MDNITHTMAGWLLGQAGLKNQSRKGLAALILAANMPDIDVFFGRVPWEPLAIHRGFTHSLVGGVLVMPPILCGLLLLLERWQVKRGVPFESGLELRPLRLLALCYIGALSHPLLDVLTTYSVQLFSPLSSRWWHADGLFIIDVWLWLLAGSAIIWSRRREKHGGDWQRPARIALAVALAYIGVNLAISEQANAAVRRESPEASRIFASPPPVWWWRRRLVWQEGACYRNAAFDPAAGMGPVSRCWRPGLGDPIVREAISTSEELSSFMRWSILPQAAVSRARCTITVSLSDARYGDIRNSRLGRDLVIPTGAPNC